MGGGNLPNKSMLIDDKSDENNGNRINIVLNESVNVPNFTNEQYIIPKAPKRKISKIYNKTVYRRKK